MADLGLTQADIDRLVPHLRLVLDMLVNPDEYEISANRDFKDEYVDVLSNTETETDYSSVFDNVGVGAKSASSVMTEHALFAMIPSLPPLPVANPGDVEEENTVGDVAMFLFSTPPPHPPPTKDCNEKTPSPPSASTASATNRSVKTGFQTALNDANVWKSSLGIGLQVIPKYGDSSTVGSVYGMPI
ncbi:hypothetical protein DL95DRAFT_466464 [Leptodontidium sp. 2 PMI_412]|nr:hypothetical protein DL95DRAFT_466464 [Leptodontidium sp. 2 PMI_412]